MKIKLGMVAMLFPLALLTIYPNDLNAADNEKPWVCKGNCRTWIVIDSNNTHMAVGDKFQINKDGQDIKFSALAQLRGRWKKEVANSFELDLTRIGPPNAYTNESRLCGFIDVDPDLHKGTGIDHGPNHMFKIKLKAKNLLQITWDVEPELSEPPKTQKDKCNELDEPAHGGRVHAEPN